MDDVPELLVIPFKGNHHSILEELRDSADPFLHVFIDHVGLLEIIVRIVHHNGDAVDELVPEELADGGIGGFCGCGGEFRQIAAVLGEIDVEVIGLDESPGKFLVLDFVLPEILVL
jgi:hypothetical protein